MSHVVATSDSRSVRGDDAAPDGAGEVFLVPFLPTSFAVGHIMPPAKAGFGAPLAAKLTPMGQRPRCAPRSFADPFRVEGIPFLAVRIRSFHLRLMILSPFREQG